jgi:hypothetical protein
MGPDDAATAKMRAAQETLLRRLNAGGRRLGKQTTVKMLLALLSLHERYLETRVRLHRGSAYTRMADTSA